MRQWLCKGLAISTNSLKPNSQASLYRWLYYATQNSRVKILLIVIDVYRILTNTWKLPMRYSYSYHDLW